MDAARLVKTRRHFVFQEAEERIDCRIQRTQQNREGSEVSVDLLIFTAQIAPQ
jgi:hypothetical protein